MLPTHSFIRQKVLRKCWRKIEGLLNFSFGILQKTLWFRKSNCSTWFSLEYPFEFQPTKTMVSKKLYGLFFLEYPPIEFSKARVLADNRGITEFCSKILSL